MKEQKLAFKLLMSKDDAKHALILAHRACRLADKEYGSVSSESGEMKSLLASAYLALGLLDRGLSVIAQVKFPAALHNIDSDARVLTSWWTSIRLHIRAWSICSHFWMLLPKTLSHIIRS